MPKTSERVVDTLIESGVTHAFTLPGLGITWSLPAFNARRDKIDVVLTRSEWIASVMAQATGLRQSRVLLRASDLLGTILPGGGWRRRGPCVLASHD
ncbi:MAG: hypothetical protein CL569_12830 [Alphaproteobacteria bacterium]|nr:hypothetical protein [Alphaproteobacteria bacterium]|tara:strand:- start:581 stop:871 length:291 start_codon:yes stop_codon:yes gene_type:complete